MSNIGLTGWDLGLVRMGADRERRRIRRAQEYGVSIVRTFSTTEHFALPESAKALLASAVEILDAATRAKKGKRK